MSDDCDYLQKMHRILVRNSPVVLLVILNFITNYLFLFQYKFYSDDWNIIITPWTAPFGYYLLSPERQIYYLIFKIQVAILHDTALWYHILGFISTSIILVLIYKIAQKLFTDFHYTSDIYPLLSAVIYCILFNKDELYPWAFMALGFYSIIYLIAFYTYINKEKEHYLGYSLIAYTIGIFTYESAMTLPLLFFSYDILLNKDYKKSFLFVIPLAINLIIRKTSWFGFGSTVYVRSFGEWGLQSILKNVIDFITASAFMSLRQIVYAFQGFQSLWGLQIVLLLLIDGLLLYLLYRQFEEKGISKKICRGSLRMAILSIIIVATFALPYIIRGGLLSGSLPTRSFEFIDIGIAFILAMVVLGISMNSRYKKILILAGIGICIILCQGLYANWVVSGEIQNNVYNYIGNHASEIESHDYVYFNTSSFIQNKPNVIDESLFYPIAKIYFVYIRHDPQAFEARVESQQQKMAGTFSSNEYDRYYNAKGLDNYALLAMLSVKVGSKFNSDNYGNLIYGKNNNVPIQINASTITFQQPYPGGSNMTINRSSVFEIRYEDVFPYQAGPA